VAKGGEVWGIYDGLRDFVKHEVDKGLTDSDSIEANRELNEAIRRIVRDEIENALKREKKQYATKGVFEIGGYISGQFHSPYSKDEGERTDVILTSGVMNFFVIDNLALSFKGAGEFDIGNNHQLYHLGIGPMFAFGLDNFNQIGIYLSIQGCLTFNSILSNKYGFRYANEVGFKFGFGRAILNVGLTVGIENNKVRASDFSTVVNPMIGITTWL